MSYRRGLSFSENDKDLVDYFDSNGKSNIVKTAMRFYIKNKDKVIEDGDSVLNKLINIISKNNIDGLLKNNINNIEIKDVKIENKVKKGFKLVK